MRFAKSMYLALIGHLLKDHVRTSWNQVFSVHSVISWYIYLRFSLLYVVHEKQSKVNSLFNVTWLHSKVVGENRCFEKSNKSRNYLTKLHFEFCKTCKLTEKVYGGILVYGIYIDFITHSDNLKRVVKQN